MSNPENLQRQLQGLAMLLQLQRKARSCEDLSRLAFLMVNETRSLLPYRQAALWFKPATRLEAVSGVAQLEANAPYLLWLKSLAQWQDTQTDTANTCRRVTAQDVPELIANDWHQWCAGFGLWLPMQELGGLWLFREMAWLDAELVMLTELADAYVHAWQALQPSVPWWQTLKFGRKQRRWLWLLLVLVLPVRQSVLAPAEIVAVDPILMRAPIDGVVSEFFVEANQTVKQGQLLLNLENTDIANRLDIASKALAVAEAEYRSNAQQAVFDNKSKADLSVLKSKIEQHQAEVAYMNDQLERSQLKAPEPGVVIFSDVQDWLGKPVSIGERIVQIANPQAVELEMQLPVADLINISNDDDAVMFLNSDPQHPLDAKVYYASYQAQLTTDNVLAYRLKARLQTSDTPPRIGLKGTARIYGQRVTLFYYVFRRPLASMRQWLGL